MKRILFIGPYPPPYGGIASHLKDLIPGLVKSNYKIVTLSWSNEEKVLKEKQRILLVKDCFQ